MKRWLAAAALLAAVSAAQAQGQGPTHEAASIESLKQAYLACDRLMSNQRVAAPLAQRCASIGERLQQRAFDGDFDRLIAWWQRERAALTALSRPLP